LIPSLMKRSKEKKRYLRDLSLADREDYQMLERKTAIPSVLRGQESGGRTDRRGTLTVKKRWLGNLIT